MKSFAINRRQAARAACLLSFLIAAQSQAQPDTVWTHVYRDEERGHGGFPGAVIATADGGFAIGTEGWAGDENRMEQDLLLIKTDSLGQLEWLDYYAVEDTLQDVWEDCTEIVQLSNGDFLLVGRGSFPHNAIIIRVDVEGHLIWSRPYTTDELRWELPECALADDDNIVVVSGGDGAKIDTDNGDIIWCNNYSNGGGFFYNVCDTDNGGFLLTGISELFSGDMHAVKIDSEGEVEWYQTYETEDHSVIICAIQSSDGGYCYGGWAAYERDQRGIIIRADREGNELWRQIFDNLAFINVIAETQDGGIVFGGYQIRRLDATGGFLWKTNFDFFENPEGFSIIPMEDGSYVVGGLESHPGTGGAYLIRTEPDPTDLPMEFAADSVLNFGEVETDTLSLLNLTVTNPGRRWSELDSIRVVDGREVFSCDYGEVARLYPWDTLKVPVWFAPLADSVYRGTLQLWVNSDSMEVLLSGCGVPPSGVSDFILQPSAFSLSVFPNPFNASLAISYQLPAARLVSLKLFDVAGRELRMLDEGVRAAGEHRIVVDGAELAAGVYLIRMNAPGISQVQKVVLIK